MAKPIEPQAGQFSDAVSEHSQRLLPGGGFDKLPALTARVRRWAERVLEAGLTPRPLCGDGGRRRYFRLEGTGRLILAGPDSAENLAWLRIGRHLWFKSLPLPRIQAYDLNQGFFLLEDLGDELLAARPGEDLFFQAVELAARLHAEGREGFDSGWCHQRARYSAAMAEHDEIGYFLKQLGRLKRPWLPSGIKAEAKALAALAVSGSEEWVLMHRDFQGRNLINFQEHLWILDWQGARPGPAAYDLSSLMEECPGQRLSEDFKDRLLRHYLKIRRLGHRHQSFRRELTVIGAVRMMQALGAFIKISLEGKDKFAAYIPAALERLDEMFRQKPLSSFTLLRSVIQDAALETGNTIPLIG